MEIFHHHIPKAGGTYIKSTLLDPLVYAHGIEGQQLSTSGSQEHYGWKDVDDETFVISSVREPMRRLVSQYEYRRVQMAEEWLAFDEWLDTNEVALTNYQSKMFAYSFDVQGGALLTKLNAMPIEVENEAVLKNVKRVDVLLRDNQLNGETLEEVRKAICTRFDLPDLINAKYTMPNYNANTQSQLTFNNLSYSQVKRLQKMTEADSEIYMDNSLFWKQGQ